MNTPIDVVLGAVLGPLIIDATDWQTDAEEVSLCTVPILGAGMIQVRVERLSEQWEPEA